MKKYINKNFPHFIHGADYNPEQWRDYEGIWDEDMRLMQLANCNEMTVGIFSWAKLEPKEGVYDFSFLDEIIEKVATNGGKIVIFGGGDPLKIGDSIVGGLGVSGGSEDEDTFLSAYGAEYFKKLTE